MIKINCDSKDRIPFVRWIDHRRERMRTRKTKKIRVTHLRLCETESKRQCQWIEEVKRMCVCSWKMTKERKKINVSVATKWKRPILHQIQFDWWLWRHDDHWKMAIVILPGGLTCVQWSPIRWKRDHARFHHSTPNNWNQNRKRLYAFGKLHNCCGFSRLQFNNVRTKPTNYFIICLSSLTIVGSHTRTLSEKKIYHFIFRVRFGYCSMIKLFVDTLHWIFPVWLTCGPKYQPKKRIQNNTQSLVCAPDTPSMSFNLSSLRIRIAFA